jgi:hypothetical protein
MTDAEKPREGTPGRVLSLPDGVRVVETLPRDGLQSFDE